MFIILWAVIWGSAAVLFGGIGISILYREKESRKRCTAQTEATVIRINEEQREEMHLYVPVVAYRAGKRAYTARCTAGEQIGCRIGQQIKMRYNPEYAEECLPMEGKMDLNLGERFIIAALACLLLACLSTTIQGLLL